MHPMHPILVTFPKLGAQRAEGDRGARRAPIHGKD